MTKEARAGLKTSLQEFGDISGIVWNKRTGELIGGNHRWDELQKIYEGCELELKHIDDTDIYAIYADGQFTSYTLREVDWDEEKASAANLTANNQNIAGYFTKEVDDILKNLTSYELFSDLKLGDLYIDIPAPQLPEDSLFSQEENTGSLTDEDESLLLSDEGYADPADLFSDEKTQKCNKAEITIMIEGDIDIPVLTEDLKKYLNQKYKVSFLNASAT